MAVQPGSTSAVNPYAAPQAALEDPAEAVDVASRWQRLGAAILDTIVFIGGNYIALLVSGRDLAAAAANPYSPPTLIAMGAIGLVNLYLLYRYRATIGKRAAGIRIASADGGEIPLWKIVFLRALPLWIVSAIPLVNLLTLVDVLFIFGSARRCVHDYIAGSIVVRASKK